MPPVDDHGLEVHLTLFPYRGTGGGGFSPSGYSQLRINCDSTPSEPPSWDEEHPQNPSQEMNIPDSVGYSVGFSAVVYCVGCCVGGSIGPLVKESIESGIQDGTPEKSRVKG
ncbi:hypothetical protein RJZ56_004078 [Blastomyces dermatitidis]|uniref:Uncharacterized protein n=3 Tax=Blastomyces TaxID=229219 RepID=A0A179U9D4_BLAGS|nr:uncharacterized protein BDBG_00454 [Blastomyces gilchristii SLH14081]XP_045273437.1 uncharacterized protein BDCG_09031 [Blastomyces dermatitidis ER-3]EGE84297.1 hypothetical protein BDDG_07242 [Blastomyces dermatitidis ATCC 18188]EQL34106.1 hypothetical protein BDFG_04021 [Blastomyces dermatitidis ATCC 26199]EEQ85762.1 hypothetical protein BDCG_09031 [Blastomyces dermatitidis ER-3]OAT03767.1 hypothetical protein BDBG_00454 [Blastomyces gilchristii SLH14081]